MSDETNALINIGDLAQPATTLIEKIADATGVLYEPYRIKKRAKAEAEAELIKAESQIKIDDLRRRALQRFVEEEAKKQENIENITGKAIPLLEKNSSPQDIDDDWIANFFDKCRIVSDEDMQTLWAKVLAGEANAPNSFSKRTVNFLASLDKADAELFVKLCAFGFLYAVDFHPLIFKTDDAIYNSHEVNFGALRHLDDIGLISFNGTTTFARTDIPKTIELNYFNSTLVVEYNKNTGNTLERGKVLLSQIGTELATICISKPVDGFIEYAIRYWIKNKNLKIWSPFPKSNA